MQLINEIKNKIISEQLCNTPSYKRYFLSFCNILNEIVYSDFTGNNQLIFCKNSTIQNCDVKVEISIVVVNESYIFNEYENVKNKIIELDDGEMIVLPNIRVFVQKNNNVFIVARKFYIVRELYSLLPYIYYKMNFFSRQPLILHACAVNIKESASCVFLGKSGDGKTTTARLADYSGLKVLSDELICITEKDDFKVVGTSISSSNCNVDIFCNMQCTLSAFCTLEKYKDFQLYKNTTKSYFNILSSSVENSVFTNDILLTVFKLCRTIPFIHMRFYKNRIEWEAFNNYLGKLNSECF